MNSDLDWFTIRIHNSVNKEEGGIFEWRIGNIGIYTGESNKLSRVIDIYPRKVIRLLKHPPDAASSKYRHVYHALAEGLRMKKRIALVLRENVPSVVVRKRRRDELIAERRLEHEDGGLAVLNEG